MTNDDRHPVVFPRNFWIASEADRAVAAAFDRPFEVLADRAGVLPFEERTQRAAALRQVQVVELAQASLRASKQPLDEAA